MSTPTYPGIVVFVDRTRWTGFDQMAATLRRRGLRVVRVTQESTAVAHAIDRLVYHESIGFRTVDELQRVLLRFDRRELLDVSTIDDLCVAVSETPWHNAPASVVARLRDRARWIDKLDASRRLAAAGVPVPEVLAAADVDPQQAVDALGLPLVVKNRVGAGGKGVRIARSVDEVADATADLGADPSEVYYEAHADGETVCYAAAFDGDRIFDEAAYESLRDPANPLGPSSSLVARDEPGLLAVGRAATRAIGSSGVVNYDLVSTGGRHLVIDVNFRVWNAAVMLRGAGCRFDLGYLAALTGRDDGAPTRVGRDGATISVFPDVIIYEIDSKGLLDLRRLEKLARPFVRWAGPGYVTSAAAYSARLWSVRAGLDRDAVLRPLRTVRRRGRPPVTAVPDGLAVTTGPDALAATMAPVEPAVEPLPAPAAQLPVRPSRPRRTQPESEPSVAELDGAVPAAVEAPADGRARTTDEATDGTV